MTTKTKSKTKFMPKDEIPAGFIKYEGAPDMFIERALNGASIVLAVSRGLLEPSFRHEAEKVIAKNWPLLPMSPAHRAMGDRPICIPNPATVHQRRSAMAFLDLIELMYG